MFGAIIAACVPRSWERAGLLKPFVCLRMNKGAYAFGSYKLL